MKKLLTTLLIASTFVPALAFATSGNQDFAPIVQQLTDYLKGSLGSVFIFLGFLGACAAVAGFASMKVMFTVFGLSLALKFGPDVIGKVFGANGDNPITMVKNNIYMIDIFILFASVVIFALGYVKYKIKKEKNAKSCSGFAQGVKAKSSCDNKASVK